MKTFEDFKISPPIMRAIKDLGYTAPSDIQLQTLPILLGDATDFIGLAATGTGKTAAFTIPLLERLELDVRSGVQGLILCPTRELAIQVAEQVNILGKHLGVRAVPVYGGAPYGEQIRGIRQGAQIVVGTPGRLVDHIERGTITLGDVHTVILDEADEMISMGFKDDLEKILTASSAEHRNIWLFSATMSKEVRNVANDYLTDPQQVQVNRQEMVPTTIEQLYYLTYEENKIELLGRLIEAADDFYGLIFCQTKVAVVDLLEALTALGHKVDSLHGDKDQNARERTMNLFKARKVTILVCTDVASRGLDVKDITHVINYSLPRELDSYVHRIGRTARSGKTGFAMSLVTPSHRALIGRIERATKSKMKEAQAPTQKELAALKITRIKDQFMAQTELDLVKSLLGTEWMESLEGMDVKEVAARFLKLSFPHHFTKKVAKAPPAREKRTVSPFSSRNNDRGGYSDRGNYPSRREGQGGGYGGGYNRDNRDSRGSGFSSERKFARPERSGEVIKTGDRKFGERRPVGNWREQGSETGARPAVVAFGKKPPRGLSTGPANETPVTGVIKLGGAKPLKRSPTF